MAVKTETQDTILSDSIQHEETVNNLKVNRLSKQEKFILDRLEKEEGIRHKRLSWLVAEQFDKKREKTWRLDYGRTRFEYGADKAGFVDKNKIVLTAKHRASLSRSIKRLIKRGLIVKQDMKYSGYCYFTSEQLNELIKQQQKLGDVQR